MTAELPAIVRIVEVGPRDGLQNEKTPVPTADKLLFVRKLVEAGLREIELTSFVRPDRIPQLADAPELCAMIALEHFPPEVRFSALVPNAKGMEAALKAGMKEVAVFIAASESFSQRNINSGIEESLLRIQPVMQAAKTHGVRVRGYLSTVFGCPYEGEVSPGKVLEVSEKLIEAGVYEISLGDTIGIARPDQVDELLALLLKHLPANRLAMHFHDTQGRALANIERSLHHGITCFDASAGGLGGCPYAEGASGNVATEAVVGLLHDKGIRTGVSVEKLREASAFIRTVLSGR